MKPKLLLYIIQPIILLTVYCQQIQGQTNPCGVVANIYPAAQDSVLTSYSSVNFINNSTNATSVQWLLNGFPSGITANSWNYGIGPGLHVISLVAFNGNCSDTTTVVYFYAGTVHNIDTLLMAHYGTSRYNEEATCIDKTLDSGFIVAAVQYPWDMCGEIGIIVKLKDKGCIDWSKKFLSPYYCNNSRVTALHASADSSYYVVTADYELVKLDRNGNLIWTKRYFSFQGSVGLPYITGDNQGAVYIASSSGFFNGWMLTKLDQNGDVIWNKFFRLSYQVPGPGGGQSEFTLLSGITILNGKIYVCGNAYTSANSYFSFLTKVDAVSGTKEWQYGYADPEFPGAMGFVHLSVRSGNRCGH